MVFLIIYTEGHRFRERETYPHLHRKKWGQQAGPGASVLILRQEIDGLQAKHLQPAFCLYFEKEIATENRVNGWIFFLLWTL